LGCVLSVFTRYERVIGVKSTEELVKMYVYPATAEVIARALGGGKFIGSLSGFSLFYLLSKVLIVRRPKQVLRILDRSAVSILAIGTRNEVDELKKVRLVRQERDKFYLLEPAGSQRDILHVVRSVLEERGINLENAVIRSSVDLLHLLEYYSVTLQKSEFVRRAEDLRAMYPRMYEEALSMARLLVNTLPPYDPERELVGGVVNVLAPERIGLERFLG